ncbi:MAG: Gfo/Idh/MocA family oxidoreductase, partial [Oscillospiraceae bacterium]|nr:Gfo/Idh/MocA family oxidoreductase [Oscillospiraceae bacterium]
MKLALIGAGQRGMIYAEYAYFKKNVEITAVVEPHDERREIASAKFSIAKENQFTCSDDFFAKGKMCDAIILASMDKDHFAQAMKALDCGYDILLEKPISPDPKECLLIGEKAKQLGRKVIVCHVLRYTNFFSKIKEIIDSGDLGKVVAIEHTENVGNFHIAHSFVRGNWRNSDETSPIIMQKSCHDMDIL